MNVYVKKKIKNTAIFFIINFLIIFKFSYAQSIQKNISLITDNFIENLEKEHEKKTILKYGKLEGNIFVPEGIDPTSVVVQVGGVNNFNKTSEDFYTVPDEQGHFIFENTFTVGSSVNLIFWDTQGLLNKRALPVYVSQYTGVYNVFLEKSSVTTDLSISFGLIQDLTKAGICGKITGLDPHEIMGSEVYLQDSKEEYLYHAKYFDENNLPSLSQNYLSENGKFCFFNVESIDNSFIYYLRLKLNNGVFKTFFVYLPNYTFSSNMEFDAKTELFRPVQLYTFNYENDYYKLNKNNNFTSWHLSTNAYFSTSYDYAAINFNQDLQNNAIYFPLGDEFLNINYSFNSENEHKFFIFQPRSALFNRKILSAAQEFVPGQTYIDYKDPVVLKMFDPRILYEKNQNALQPLYNENFGSLFLNFDASDFYFDKKNLKFYLKDISGQDVSYFVALDGIASAKEVSGFFYNIPQGLYQLFVTVPTSIADCDNCTTFNDNEKLLWSSVVESLSNKTQVLTNTSDNKILIEDKLAEIQDESVSVSKETNAGTKIPVEILPDNKNYDVQSLNLQKFLDDLDSQYIKTHSLFYQLDEHELCHVPKEKENKNINMFMGLVPNVDIIKTIKHEKPMFNHKDNRDLNFMENKFVVLMEEKLLSK